MQRTLRRNSHFIAAAILMSGLLPVSLADSNDFYTLHDESLGIEVKAPKSVDPAALKAAKRSIANMLRNRPDIAKRMKERKAALAIIPRGSFITVLPEFRPLSGKKDPNGSLYDSFTVRGAGGVPGQPVTATSEENLLRLKGDPFTSEDITCHEFAHAIMRS